MDSKQIRVSNDVYNLIQDNYTSMHDNCDSILRRLLRLPPKGKKKKNTAKKEKS